MRFEPTPLAGAWIIDLELHADERGFFARTFCAREFADRGLPTTFPQSNLSRNATAGTLRGMHFNTAAHAESKVVRCTQGAIHDVIIDLRADSQTYRQWFAVELTAVSGRALFVPEGFAHGFLTLVDETDVEYQMGAFYAPEAARGLRWDDPAIGVEWPREPMVMSPRDATYPDFDPAVLDA
jgi:dTDP-4-dehydrorhamnose 3,5-epimerase